MFGVSATQIARQDITIALDLVSEVQKLHQLGYLHGDLAPINVIVVVGRVHLVNFEHSTPISDALMTLDEEMMMLLSLLVRILSQHPLIVYRLMSLCEESKTSRLGVSLRTGISYTSLRYTIAGTASLFTRQT